MGFYVMSVLSMVIGAILGALLSYWFTKKLDRKRENKETEELLKGLDAELYDNFWTVLQYLEDKDDYRKKIQLDRNLEDSVLQKIKNKGILFHDLPDVVGHAISTPYFLLKNIQMDFHNCPSDFLEGRKNEALKRFKDESERARYYISRHLQDPRQWKKIKKKLNFMLNLLMLMAGIFAKKIEKKEKKHK